jgi:hypothetical protein
MNKPDEKKNKKKIKISIFYILLTVEKNGLRMMETIN